MVLCSWLLLARHVGVCFLRAAFAILGCSASSHCVQFAYRRAVSSSVAAYCWALFRQYDVFCACAPICLFGLVHGAPFVPTDAEFPTNT